MNFFPECWDDIPIEAEFLGTHVEAASFSSGTALLVTPFYPTTTTITASGNPGNYMLTATVTGTGGD